jgi:hypothetical protein
MYYMVVEMLPATEVMKAPSGNFSKGCGFESPGTVFEVRGPEYSTDDFEYSRSRLEDNGYNVSYVFDRAPLT